VVLHQNNPQGIIMHHSTQENSSVLLEMIHQVTENGESGMLEAMRVLLNEAMKVERSNSLDADPYERNESRLGYANGYKNKTVNTRLGTMKLNIPQVRGEVDFYPSSLEKGLRSERALMTAMAESYIQGTSTRKVTKLLEKMCGLSVSKSQVSRVVSELDESLEKWRNRPLGKYSYLLVDARYEKVRVDKTVRDCALLIAYGIDESGKRSVLGTSVSLSEAEVHWRNFFLSLNARGLHGLKMITSDSHSGLKAALKTVFGSIPWQRCQFHLQQNAGAYVPKKAMRSEVAQDIRDIFNAPSKLEAERLLKLNCLKYEEKASHLSEWMESALPEGFSVFDLDRSCWTKLRTTNMIERQNREILRRTRTVSIFPNEASLLRLASAILMELDETWIATKRVYLSV
jgi:putative transposase